MVKEEDEENIGKRSTFNIAFEEDEEVRKISFREEDRESLEGR